MLIEIINDHLGNDIPLQLENDSNRLVRLIPRIADPLQLFLLNQLRNPLDQLLRVHIVRNLSDHQLLFARAPIFYRNLPPQLQGTTPSLVVRHDRFFPANQRTGWEIWPWHNL